MRADSQWIIILKTFELVTLSFSQFHAQRNWLLTHALHIFNLAVHRNAMLFLKPDVTKKNREFFFSLFVLLDLLFTASSLIFDFGLNV